MWTCGRSTGKFATIDYSDEKPALYLGEMVEFDELGAQEPAYLRGVVMSSGGPHSSGEAAGEVAELSGMRRCIAVRSFGNAVTIVCESCHSILDAKDPRLEILQRFKVATDEVQPLIPLGTRGKIRGADYEVIGFERRTIHVDGIPYSWHEYVLFNPYKGFPLSDRIQRSLERHEHSESAARR